MSAAAEVDDVAGSTVRTVGREFDPDEAVIYPGQQVGGFSDDGVVIMSDDPDFGMWDVSNFERVENPERFDKECGVWVPPEYVPDEVLDECLEDAPTVGADDSESAVLSERIDVGGMTVEVTVDDDNTITAEEVTPLKEAVQELSSVFSVPGDDVGHDGELPTVELGWGVATTNELTEAREQGFIIHAVRREDGSPVLVFDHPSLEVDG